MVKIKNICFYLTLIVISWGLIPQSGFSEDKSKGFYAGPLSDTAANIQKKEDLKKIKKSPLVEEKSVADESNIVKTEPFSFKSWLRKVFKYGK